MRPVLLAIAGLVAGACAYAQPAAEMNRSGFVNAEEAIPGLVIDIRYHGGENFIGRRIAGYEAPVCLLTKDAATALVIAQASLKASGHGLKVFDCYRPARAVADFAAWARDPHDERRKADYYPNTDKSRLFELGYIAEKSGHSRGSTVDVTIVNARTGAELDMGSGYDLFDTISWPADQRVSEQAQANRMLLQDTMTKAGFRPLKEEWWHFTLNSEPYPETYFDFVVK